MPKSKRSRFLVNQAMAAKMLSVDRTTIRSWCEAGMPHIAPEGRGVEGSYDWGLCSYWSVWTTVRTERRWPKLKPLQAIAVAYAIGADDPLVREEGAREFPKLVVDHFDRPEAVAAYYWALGFLDAHNPN